MIKPRLLLNKETPSSENNLSLMNTVSRSLDCEERIWAIVGHNVAVMAHGSS